MAASLSCLLAGYVVAQQQTVREQAEPAVDQPGEQSAAGQTDRPATRREYTANFRGNQANAGAQNQDVQRYLVGCMLAKNQAEVELSKFAQQQTQSPEIKEFAQMLVQDHSKFIQKLQQLAGDQTTAIGQPGERNQPAGNREAVSQNAAELKPANRATDSNSAVGQLLALEKQIVERCAQSARDELQQKEGAEFDKCFVGSQIGGHMQMLAALEVLSQQGPEQIQQIAQEAQPNVQKHLEHAKHLMKQLEGAGPTGSRATRPTQPQR
jgi:predicted outer membrane protein